MNNFSQKQYKERAVLFAEYIIENKATVRTAAKAFGISKSTVHKDITEKLPLINPSLYSGVKEILEINKKERHIRGGMATKHKYEGMNTKKNKSEAHDR